MKRLEPIHDEICKRVRPGDQEQAVDAFDARDQPQRADRIERGQSPARNTRSRRNKDNRRSSHRPVPSMNRFPLDRSANKRVHTTRPRWSSELQWIDGGASRTPLAALLVRVLTARQRLGGDRLAIAPGNDECGQRALLVIFELFRLEIAEVLLDGLLGQIQPIGSELPDGPLAPALSDGPASAALLDKLEFADRNA
jgi:hypothetical protein